MIEVLVPFALVLALAGGIAAYVVRAERRLRAAFDALGARRGWQVEMAGKTAAGRKGRVVRPAAGGPEDWEFAQITTSSGSNAAGKAGGSATRTEWTDAGRRSPGGLWAFTPPIPPEAAAMAESFAGFLGGGTVQALLGRFLGPIAAELPGLRQIEAPGGRPRGFTLFASGPETAALDFDGIEAALADWTAARGAPPVFLAEPDRLRLRLDRAVKDAAEAEALIDLGRRLAPLFPLNHPDR